jgi:hypothetical protein
MTVINVQFSDADKTEIVAVFSCPQDPEIFPNQGQVDLSDPMWEKYYSEQPAMIQALLPAPTATQTSTAG